MNAAVNVAGNRRCSVYLNNVGYALMRQGSFQDAMKTFSDALFVMKHGVYPYTSTTELDSTNSPLAGPSVPCLDLQAKMKRSDQRLACHQACKTDKSSSDTEAFEIIELDDYLQIEIDDLLCREEPDVLLCPIRIDAELTKSNASDSMELITGTLLYNLGLSHICFAKGAPTPDDHRQEHRGAATRFFQLADCILHRLLIANPDDVINQDYELGKLVAMTDMAVIHSYYQLVIVDSLDSEETLLTDAHDKVCRRLSYLQDCIYMKEWSYMGGFPNSTAAAVA